MGRGVPHLLPKDELTRESSFRPRRGIVPVVFFVLGCLADVLCERRTKCRSGFVQSLAESPEAFALIVGERVHRIQDQGPHSRFLQFVRQMLTVQLEQDGVEKTLRLPAGGAGGDDDVLSIHMRGAYCEFLMDVQRVVEQRREKLLTRPGKTLLR